MQRILLCLTIMMLTVGLASARPADSAEPADSARRAHARSYDVWVPAAGAAFATATSTVARGAYPRGFGVTETAAGPDRGMGYIRFAPVALPWVMKAFGSPTRSSWGRMAVSQGLSAAIMIASVEGLKHSVSSLRPDGSDKRSFPSGHTAIAFMGATMTAHELAPRSPLYALGAFALASAVAAERVLDGHHYPTDVVAGAGLGILSTEIGYWIGDRIFGDRGLQLSEPPLTENLNLSYLQLSTGLLLPLGRIDCGPDRISRLPALSVSVRGGLAIGDNWGLAVETGLLSMPLVVKSGVSETYVKNLSSINFGLGPYMAFTLSRCFTLNVEATAGYRVNFGLNTVGDAMTASGGTPTGRIGFGGALRLSDRFRCNANAGWELSSYKFTLHPSDYYSIKADQTVKSLTSSILFSVSATYDL